MNSISHHVFLTESKCVELKNQIRNDFFSRLDKASMRHDQPNFIQELDIIEVPNSKSTRKKKRKK